MLLENGITELIDEKTHAAINRKLFKTLNHVKNAIYDVELAEAEIEYKEPVKVGFFILQYAKLRIMDLNSNFSNNCNKIIISDQK